MSQSSSNGKRGTGKRAASKPGATSKTAISESAASKTAINKPGMSGGRVSSKRAPFDLKGLLSDGSLVAIALMVIVVAAVMIWNQVNPITYFVYDTSHASYAKGTVTQILDNQLVDEPGTGRHRGQQIIKVEVHEGKFAGQQVQITNDLSATHNIEATVGLDVVVKVDDPGKGVDPFFSLFNYDRTLGFGAVLLLFAALMVAVGGLKGLKSLLGLLFSLFMVLMFLLPAIYHGLPPILMTVVTALIITVLCMALLNGFSKKTWTAIGSTAVGVLAAVAIYLVFSVFLHLNGYVLDQADELIQIQQATGLDVGQMLFVGVLVASLGAVMDMCMSVATSLYEMKSINPELSASRIFTSGMHIGRDMIGTMCMTLILAFAGSAIVNLLVMVSFGAHPAQLLSSDYVAIELVHSFIGGMAVVLSVPITSAISAWMLDR